MQFISNEEAGNTKKAELETRAFRRCRQLWIVRRRYSTQLNHRTRDALTFFAGAG